MPSATGRNQVSNNGEGLDSTPPPAPPTPEGEPDWTRRPWIAGHRGASGHETENTLESMRLAHEQGADLIEADIQMAADSTLVVFHDWNLERLAGNSTVIEEATGDGLREVVLAGPRIQQSHETPERKIPTLDELLALARELTIPLNLELKRQIAEPEAFAARLIDQLSAWPEGPWILVSSFDWELLASVRDLAPALPLAPLSKRDRRGLVETGQRLGAWSLHAHRRLAGRRLVRAGQRSGRPVLAYTVNDPAEARRLARRGVTGFFTDYPGRLKTAFGAG